MKNVESISDPDIIAGNELMAKYIGGIKYTPSWEKEAGSSRSCWILPTRSDHMFLPQLPEKLHFHDSWDWLIPVWVLWLNEFINNPIDKTQTYLAVRDGILSGNIGEVWAQLKLDLEIQKIRLN